MNNVMQMILVAVKASLLIALSITLLASTAVPASACIIHHPAETHEEYHLETRYIDVFHPATGHVEYDTDGNSYWVEDSAAYVECVYEVVGYWVTVEHSPARDEEVPDCE